MAGGVADLLKEAPEGKACRDDMDMAWGCG